MQRERQVRYRSMASIRIKDFEGYAHIKNISPSGCCISSKTYVNLTVKQQYLIEVCSERELGLAPFEIPAQVMWVRTSETLCAVGFFFITPSDRSLSQYIDYLKSQGSSLLIH
jgi:hypothetical protein